jgi:L-asparaginase II
MDQDILARRAVPLARVIRGELVECIHVGHVAVTDRDGRVLHAAGDPDTLTFTRSALKPLQALPFVTAGGDARFGYSRAQVALLCASHSGEPAQVAAVADMLARCGASERELLCGTQVPRWFELEGRYPPPPPYSPLAHNCSGKHAGMLACCVMHGWPRDDYVAYDHPLQAAIREAVAATSGVAAADLVAGIDGCSAPNYALPLARLAAAYARLATAGDASPALANLASAMIAHPEMVSGQHRNDLALAQAGRGDWVTKVGAEGVQAIGVKSRGIGIAIKVADGSQRGLMPATVAVLDALGLLDDEARRALAAWARPALSNFRGIPTGRIEPAVTLGGGRPAAPAALN